ncbi:MAG: hypothetical protein Tsb0020_06180 [Haliangiales bacterium]
MVWERPDEASVTLKRADGGPGYSVLDGSEGGPRPADDAAVRDLFGTLTLLRAERSFPVEREERGLDSPRVRVRAMCDDGGETEFAIGDRIAALDRVWLAMGRAESSADVDYLIAGYAARSIDRTAAELRARQVFPQLERMRDGFDEGVSLEVRATTGRVRIVGDPAMIQLDGSDAFDGLGGRDGLGERLRVRADSGRVSELLRRLSELRIARFVGARVDAVGAEAADEPDTVVMIGRDSQLAPGTRSGRDVAPEREQDAGSPVPWTLRAWGACSPLVEDTAADVFVVPLRYVETPIGAGCVAADALQAIEALVSGSLLAHQLLDPSMRLGAVEIAPAPTSAGAALEMEAFALIARGGAWSLRVGGGGWGEDAGVGAAGVSDLDQRAEVEAVRAWLRDLAGATSGDYLVADDPRISAEASLTITLRGGRDGERGAGGASGVSAGETLGVDDVGGGRGAGTGGAQDVGAGGAQGADAGGARIERIRIFRALGDAPAVWYARRDQEPIAFALDHPVHASGLLSIAGLDYENGGSAALGDVRDAVGALRFRPRELLSREPYSLRELRAYRRGRLVAHIERGNGLSDWRVRVPAGHVLRADTPSGRAPEGAVTEPGRVHGGGFVAGSSRVEDGVARAEARASGVVIDSLRQAIARLRAQRFIAAEPRPAHRLSPPVLRVEARFDPGPLDPDDAPLRHVIELGADTLDGCLARLDGHGSVFEIDRARCALLSGRWTQRR